jgi:hypothetical protein
MIIYIAYVLHDYKTPGILACYIFPRCKKLNAHLFRIEGLEFCLGLGFCAVYICIGTCMLIYL